VDFLACFRDSFYNNGEVKSLGALKSIGHYLKTTEKIYWAIALAISAYSLLLLRTLPSKNYFMTMLVAVAIGYAGAIIITLIDYHDLASIWYIIALLCVFLILYTLKFGKAVTNTGGVYAKAWISLGSTSFQPSELVKIGFMVTFAKHLSILEERDLLKSPLNIMLLAVHALIPIVLTHLQGDDGAGIIFFCMFLAMAFGAGIQLRYFFALFAVIGAALPLAWKYVLADYQKQRMLAAYQLDTTDESLQATIWQQQQARTSIGSGGIWGRGLFDAPRVASKIVPEQESDMIFSTAGEELGFVGCCLILLLLLFLLWRTLRIARKSPDLLGSSICMGFFGMIAAQVIFNIGMCVDLLPVMGVTLPFFSAGGSSAACLYFGLGLVENVHMHPMNPTKVSVRL
jgi:rod shape determining protein RodA